MYIFIISLVHIYNIHQQPGMLDQAKLREYLSGPPMEIEVHDRDRIMEKPTLIPTLFGDDLEDEKISSVGIVSGLCLFVYKVYSLFIMLYILKYIISLCCTQ